jgi:hypothetical protein
MDWVVCSTVCALRVFSRYPFRQSPSYIQIVFGLDTRSSYSDSDWCQLELAGDSVQLLKENNIKGKRSTNYIHTTFCLYRCFQYKIYPSATSISDQPFEIHFRGDVKWGFAEYRITTLPLRWPRCINGCNVLSSQSIIANQTYLKQWVSSHVSTRDSPETACIDMLYGLHRPGLGISDRLDSSQPRVSTAHPHTSVQPRST